MTKILFVLGSCSLLLSGMITGNIGEAFAGLLFLIAAIVDSD